MPSLISNEWQELSCVCPDAVRALPEKCSLDNRRARLYKEHWNRPKRH